jgi:hypothetical protein
VVCYVLFVCDCVLPPGDNPIAVNKIIIIIIIIINRAITEIYVFLKYEKRQINIPVENYFL